MENREERFDSRRREMEEREERQDSRRRRELDDGEERFDSRRRELENREERLDSFRQQYRSLENIPSKQTKSFLMELANNSVPIMVGFIVSYKLFPILIH
ncbi:hypothetical protein BLOT_012889 [Blomia tropicalis]|nr:hypothetical protein BLOT_012889 [Blomia tropicalis]